MISDNSIDNILTPLSSVDKALIAEDAKKFNLAAPITEEEFTDALQKLGTYMLFGTSWDPTKQVRIPKKIPIISDVPMYCMGHNCKYAQLCPVIAIMKEKDVGSMIGSQCRADRILGVQHFTSLVKDLNIEPNQTVDIINVANLVRWMIYRRRVDWQIALEGLTVLAAVDVDRKTNEKFGEIKEHPLLKTAERIDSMIDKAQKSLVASRKDRLQAAAQFGKEKEALLSIFNFNVDEETEALPPADPSEESEE